MRGRVQISRSEGLLSENCKVPQSVLCYVLSVEQRAVLTDETLKVRRVSINEILHSSRVVLYISFQVLLVLFKSQSERSLTRGTEEKVAS
jgi:hypothetical protein